MLGSIAISAVLGYCHSGLTRDRAEPQSDKAERVSQRKEKKRNAQRSATQGKARQCNATHCNATHLNVLQRDATRTSVLP